MISSFSISFRQTGLYLSMIPTTNKPIFESDDGCQIQNETHDETREADCLSDATWSKTTIKIYPKYVVTIADATADMVANAWLFWSGRATQTFGLGSSSKAMHPRLSLVK